MGGGVVFKKTPPLVVETLKLPKICFWFSSATGQRALDFSLCEDVRHDAFPNASAEPSQLTHEPSLNPSLSPQTTFKTQPIKQQHTHTHTQTENNSVIPQHYGKRPLRKQMGLSFSLIH